MDGSKSKFQEFHNLCLQVFGKGNPNHETFDLFSVIQVLIYYSSQYVQGCFLTMSRYTKNVALLKQLYFRSSSSVVA